MKSILLFALCLLLSASAILHAQETSQTRPTLSFAGTEYFQQYSGDGENRYTRNALTSQFDWEDMVTTITFPGLGSIQSLLEKSMDLPAPYRNLGDVTGVDVPRVTAPATATTPESFLIVFEKEGVDFIEVSYVRLYLSGFDGNLVAYSHRTTGNEHAQRDVIWRTENMFTILESLIAWNPIDNH